MPWKSGGIDEDDEDHEKYLGKFRKSISMKLQNLINKSLEEEPELKSKKKIVNVCINFVLKIIIIELRKIFVFRIK